MIINTNPIIPDGSEKVFVVLHKPTGKIQMQPMYNWSNEKNKELYEVLYKSNNLDDAKIAYVGLCKEQDMKKMKQKMIHESCEWLYMMYNNGVIKTDNIKQLVEDHQKYMEAY